MTQVLVRLNAFRLSVRINPHMCGGHYELHDNVLYFIATGCVRRGTSVEVAYPALCQACWFCGGAFLCTIQPFAWLDPVLLYRRFVYLVRCLTEAGMPNA